MRGLREFRRSGVRRGAALMAAVLMGVSACGGRTDGERVPRSPASGAAGVEIGHVHGLGVDPADGAVYMGTHFGLFRLGPQNTAQRVGGYVRDLMGFTVAGPKTFLGSGHPGAEEASEGAPAHLGLIRSTDAGRTWSAVSGEGEADFHALQPAGRLLYAYDSDTATTEGAPGGRAPGCG